MIIEARNRLGGRILTAPTETGQGYFDLGPTWFWPDHVYVQRLARELGLAHFEQFETGCAIYDRGPKMRPERFLPPENRPSSYRLVGGMQALVHCLAARLSVGVSSSTVVREVTAEEQNLIVSAQVKQKAMSYRAQHVIITLPPRLVSSSLRFTPALPPEVIAAMDNTQTWMGQAMKVILVYAKPFWRQNGLSGLGLSHIGPVQQFHDATPTDEKVGALFGWLGNESFGRALSKNERRQAVIEQARRMFGEEAQHPLFYAELNWANEPYTTHSSSGLPAEQEHPHYGHPLLQPPQMSGRLHWASAEVSPVNGGYLDGAIYIGEKIAARVSQNLCCHTKP